MSDLQKLVLIFDAIEVLHEPPVELADVAAEMTDERCKHALSAALHLSQLAILGKTGLPPVVMTEGQFHAEVFLAQMVGIYAFWSQLVHHAEIDEDTCRIGRRMLSRLAKEVYAENKGLARSDLEAEIFRYCGLEPVKPEPEPEMEGEPKQ